MDNRLFVKSILWMAGNPARWRNLQEVFGKWTGVHARFRRWSHAGVWERLFLSLPTLLTTTGAAACLRVSSRTLASWRAIGEGPAFARRGVRNIRYQREDLTAYITGRRRLNKVAMPSRHAADTEA